MIPVAVHGAEGRMGTMVTDLVEAAADTELVGLFSEQGRDRPAGAFHAKLPLLGQDKLAEALPQKTVIVDFSLAGALAELLGSAEKTKSPLVIGTTGFSDSQLDDLKNYSRHRPVVLAANFSIGIPALRMLLQLLARTLPEGFTAEQIETHHLTKLDKPSGTALNLARVFSELRGGQSVPIHSQRLGGVVGEHTWTFSDAEETLVLTHRAHSRRAFLRGVLPAVRFVASRESGFYSLDDVLLALGTETEA